MPRDSKYHQGLFHPRHPEKYVGDINNIVYRSSWELRFLQYCDSNDNIIQYPSEAFAIPYLSPIDNKVHRYYPDYLIKVKESNGSIKKYVIEVKPKRQTEKPKKRSRVTKTYINEMRLYAVNQAKWKYAQEFCKDNLLEFKIITEEQLFNNNGSGTRRVSRKSKK